METRANITEIIDRTSAEWMRDSDAPNCGKCDAKFSLVRRRHHCRICGKIYCDECTDYIPVIGGDEAALACDSCCATLLAKRKAEHKAKQAKQDSLKGSLGAFKPCTALPSLAFQQMMEHGTTIISEEKGETEEELTLPTGWKEMIFLIDVIEKGHWVKDNESEKCSACEELFTNVVRRHHCRGCGQLFCGDCAPLVGNDSTNPWDYDAILRACGNCCKLSMKKKLKGVNAEAEKIAAFKADADKLAKARKERIAEEERKQMEDFERAQEAKKNKWTDKHAKWENDEQPAGAETE